MPQDKSVVDFATEYDNFSKPLLGIKIDDQELDTKTLLINDVVCEVGTDFASSICTMKVKGAETEFSEQDGKLVLDESLDKFQLGSKIELQLGYLVEGEAKAKPVFTGFITKITLSYVDNDNIIYNIECMDVKELMMHNVSSGVYEVQKSSEAIAEALKNYEKYFESSDIEDTADEVKLVHHGLCSDYEFLCEMAKKFNYLFFVSNNKVYFKKASSLTDKKIQVSTGYYLFDFEYVMDLHNQVKQVTVLGMPENGGKEIISSTVQEADIVGNGEKSVSEVTNVVEDFMSVTIVDHEAKTPERAEARAKAELAARSMEFIQGKFCIIGLPDLEVGTVVSINGIGEQYDKEFLITNIRHEMHYNSYYTYCNFRGSKL